MQDRSIDAEEIARFGAQAGEWWNPDGAFAPLHRLNPLRLAFIRDRLCDHFGRDPMSERPLRGLTILDIGCGGGILTEPMARLGAKVIGVDPSEANIEAAQTHAVEAGLDIAYHATTAEALVAEKRCFDAVLCMEAVEHVGDVGVFLEAVSRLAKSNGAFILSTLNRTAKSFLLAIVGAEYVLRWVPRGTHDWRKFVRPSELAARLRPQGLEIRELAGVVYDPIDNSWRLDPENLAVNYMAYAAKGGD